MLLTDSNLNLTSNLWKNQFRHGAIALQNTNVLNSKQSKMTRVAVLKINILIC